jgi:hypothetical protein
MLGLSGFRLWMRHPWTVDALRQDTQRLSAVVGKLSRQVTGRIGSPASNPKPAARSITRLFVDPLAARCSEADFAKRIRPEPLEKISNIKRGVEDAASVKRC